MKAECNSDAQVIKLKDCCKITSSKRIFAADYISEGVPFVRGKEIVNNFRKSGKLETELYISRNKFEEIKNHFGIPVEGDLLLTSVGTLGVPYLVKADDEFYFKDGNLIWFRNFNELKSKFFYYWLCSYQGKSELSKCTIGTSQTAYTIERLKEIEIVIPDKQDVIASVLSTYDDLIENNRRRIQLLEESARLLYREWFVHLRFPGHEHVKVVDGVPEGWERKTIDDIAETIGGGTPSTKVLEYWENGEIPWFSPSDLTKNNCLILLDSNKKITETGLKKSSAKMLPPETILMSSRASIGFFGLYEFECCTNQGFISCVPKYKNFRMYLLYNLMARVEEIIGLASGTTFKEISKKTFRSIPVIMPESEILEEFENYVCDLINQIRVLQKQNQKLIQARDLLLPRLMSGEIEL